MLTIIVSILWMKNSEIESLSILPQGNEASKWQILDANRSSLVPKICALDPYTAF